MDPVVRVRSCIEEQRVADVAVPLGIVVSSRALPNHVVSEIPIPKHLIHQHLHVVNRVPIEMHVDASTRKIWTDQVWERRATLQWRAARIGCAFSMGITRNLANRTAIVTGASRGLGRVIAEALANEGVRVALLARSEDALQSLRSVLSMPEQHTVARVDLLDAAAIAGAVAKVRKALGAIDIVVHVAGGGLGLHEDLLSADELARLFQLNIGSVAEINRLVVPEMIARRRGHLVHVGSIASVEATASVGYNTVKAAMAAYVRTLGRSLAKHDVVATGILPGGFAAPGNAMDRLQQSKPDVYEKFIQDRLPRGRMGRAEELVPLLLYLCSDHASMMGGCMVPIDAGEGLAYGG